MTLRKLFSLVVASALCGCVSAAQTNRSAAGANTHEAARNPGMQSAATHANSKKRSILRLRADRLSQPAALEPSLDSESDYAGPSDPSNPSSPLICNAEVQRAVNNAWSFSVQAAHRPPTEFNNKVEFGFAINVNDTSLVIEHMRTSDRTDGRPNDLNIPVAENTVATVHTHNIGARSTPSAADVKSDLPAFVKSQSYLYVTIPGTNHYAMVELNRVCNGN